MIATSRWIALAFLIFLFESSVGFTPMASRTTSSALKLVPEQGRQLVAYSQAALAKKAKESASKASNLTSSRRRNSDENSTLEPGGPRNFLTRLLGAGGETQSHIPPEELEPQQRLEDEVLYPLVGFNLVNGHALPTTQSAACKLNLFGQGIEEEVVGWFGEEGANIRD